MVRQLVFRSDKRLVEKKARQSERERERKNNKSSLEGGFS